MDSQSSSTDYLRLATHFISWAFFLHLKRYTPVFMPPKQSKPRAHWNDAETSALIDYLHAHRSEAEGGASFPTKTYNGALEYIKNLNLHTQGAEKTVQHVKDKTKLVSNKFMSIETLLIFLNLQLKDQWKAIDTYRSSSGASWDYTCGGFYSALPTDLDQFKDYCKSLKKQVCFHFISACTNSYLISSESRLYQGHRSQILALSYET